MHLSHVLIRPVETEKTLADKGTATFVVAEKATKQDITAAVETYYKREVKAVRTLRNAEKYRMTRYGKAPRRKTVKKAIITFVTAEPLDINSFSTPA
ncbi:50S ribosomal protein L23 [Candidatus Peribacteria bacterium]|nr:50S ribosomal protein L23 [Candidatus Peribacteria bacterium]